MDGTQYTYNAVNQPTTETTPTGDTIRTGYWADRSRAHLTTGDGADAAATTFYWDGATLINDTHTTNRGDTVDVAAYLIGTTRHARTTTTGQQARRVVLPGRPAREHHHLTTDTGDVSATYAYSDYGTPATDDASRGRSGCVAGR